MALRDLCRAAEADAPRGREGGREGEGLVMEMILIKSTPVAVESCLAPLRP